MPPILFRHRYRLEKARERPAEYFPGEAISVAAQRSAVKPWLNGDRTGDGQVARSVKSKGSLLLEETVVLVGRGG
jgi:hypothetical protein